MEDKIKKYKKLNPNVGFFTLSEIFGIDLKFLLKIFLKKDYYYRVEEYKDSVINKKLKVRDELGRIIYKESNFGYWTKYVYDDNHVIIYEENADGYWIKREYMNFGEYRCIDSNNCITIKQLKIFNR